MKNKRNSVPYAFAAAKVAAYWDGTPIYRLRRVREALRNGTLVDESDRAFILEILDHLFEKERARFEKAAASKAYTKLIAPIADYLVKACRGMTRAQALEVAGHGLVKEAAGLQAMTRLNQRSKRRRKKNRK